MIVIVVRYCSRLLMASRTADQYGARFERDKTTRSGFKFRVTCDVVTGPHPHHRLTAATRCHPMPPDATQENDEPA